MWILFAIVIFLSPCFGDDVFICSMDTGYCVNLDISQLPSCSITYKLLYTDDLVVTCWTVENKATASYTEDGLWINTTNNGYSSVDCGFSNGTQISVEGSIVDNIQYYSRTGNLTILPGIVAAYCSSINAVRWS